MMCAICRARKFALRYMDGRWFWYCWDGHLIEEE